MSVPDSLPALTLVALSGPHKAGTGPTVVPMTIGTLPATLFLNLLRRLACCAYLVLLRRTLLTITSLGCAVVLNLLLTSMFPTVPMFTMVKVSPVLSPAL